MKSNKSYRFGALACGVLGAAGCTQPGAEPPPPVLETAATCTPAVQTLDDTVVGTGLSQIEYDGTWATSAAAAKYDGTDHYSATAGSKVVVRFSGTAITLYGARAPHHGIAGVSLDGGAETSVDFYAATRADQVEMVTLTGLANATHTLRVRVTGTHNAASTDNVISVDRVDITGCGTTTTTPPPKSGFLTRSGKNLMLDGAVYKFVGVNAFGLTGCRTGTPDTQAVVDAFFGSLRPTSLTRTWAFKPQGLAGVQRVVASAEAHNQKLVLALADGANFCNDTGHDAAFYAGGFRGAYFNWIRTVVPMFKDSPAVGIWEMMNEPSGASSDQVMRAFFDETAALIKSLDPNHLVGTGALAEYVPGTMDYAFVHGGPNVDVGSLHEYDYAFQNSRTIVSGHLNPTLSAMNSINKPMYIGEVGISLSDTCMTAQDRANVLIQKFNAYLGAGTVGVLYWNWVSNPDTSCGADVGTSDGPGSAVMAAIKNYQIP